jgi:hypothetical protein
MQDFDDAEEEEIKANEGLLSSALEKASDFIKIGLVSFVCKCTILLKRWHLMNSSQTENDRRVNCLEMKMTMLQNWNLKRLPQRSPIDSRQK